MSTAPLTSSGSYDRSAIMRTAWARARGEMAAYQRDRLPAPTLRKAFAWALRRTWDEARGYRATKLWLAERDAALAAMTIRERRIAELRQAIAVAPMIDSTTRSLSEKAAAERALAEALAS